MFVSVQVVDYPLEPLEGWLFARIVALAGWDGQYSQETIKEMAERIQGASYRMCEYALKLLSAAKVIEQVVENRNGKPFRLGWRPQATRCWVAPAEVSALRRQIYSNRKPVADEPLNIPQEIQSNLDEGSVSSNVVSFPKSRAIPPPRPSDNFMTEAMIEYIDNSCPLVAATVIAEMHKFHSYHEKPKHNRVTGQSETVHHTLEQWQDLFLGWMDRANANAAQKMGKYGKAEQPDAATRKRKRAAYDWEATA